LFDSNSLNFEYLVSPLGIHDLGGLVKKYLNLEHNYKLDVRNAIVL